jgi:hypothetical protein
MGWSLGFDSNWNRDIGYGVPATCDHPECNADINRGLYHVCCEQEPYGGENGCGLYFCDNHRNHENKCERCQNEKEPFEPKPEHHTWANFKLTDKSWNEWRINNPDKVAELELISP